MFGRKKKSALREKYEMTRSLAGLDPTQQEWVASEVAKRQRLVSARSLACSVCPEPAIVVRARAFPPPIAQAMGFAPGKVAISVHQFCSEHSGPSGLAELQRLDIEIRRQRKESHRAGEDGVEFIAFEK